MNRLRSLPISVWLVLPAIVAALIPGSGPLLQFDRSAIAAGEWWRVVTGHWVHWSPDHAFWDILVFAVLGPLTERRDRRRLLRFLGIALASTPLALVVFEPQIATYRGLSGLDTGLFTLLVADLFAESWRLGDRRRCIVLGLAGAALGGKTLFELLTGDTLFVQSRESDFVPLVSMHLVGAMAAGLTFCRSDRIAAQLDMSHTTHDHASDCS